MVKGLTTMPDSNFLTLRTSSACLGASRFLWMTPMPPDCAMAMAMRLSVTVSMAEESSGMPSSMVAVRRVCVLVSVGRTAEAAGSNNTSSKVSASRICMPHLEPGNGAPSYTRNPRSQGEAGIPPNRSTGFGIAAPEALGDHVDLGRIGSTRRRFDMAHFGEIALQSQQQI